jgi:hypothetical protein
VADTNGWTLTLPLSPTKAVVSPEVERVILLTLAVENRLISRGAGSRAPKDI